MDRGAAWELLSEFTKSESLRKHALAVEACLRAYALPLGQQVLKLSEVTRSRGGRQASGSGCLENKLDQVRGPEAQEPTFSDFIFSRIASPAVEFSSGERVANSPEK